MVYFKWLFLSVIGFDAHYWWSYIVIGSVSGILTKKLFATRSLYALEGLGIVMFTIFSILNTAPVVLRRVFTSQDLAMYSQTPLKDYFLSLIFLIVGLYFGFLFAKFIERLATETFIVKQKM